MVNIRNTKLNLFELESLRSKLIDETLNTTSNNLRLFLYQNYFSKTLSLSNSNLEEAFLKEFLDDYLHCVIKYDVWGNDTSVTKKIFVQLNDICKHSFAEDHFAVLSFEIKRIELQWIKLTAILNGEDFEDGEIHKAFFPLIDNEAPGEFYGTVESVTVRISKAVNVDKYIIVPSEKEIEKRIFEQCRNSWLLALNISKKYVKKLYKHHEVIISFDKKEGFYEGNSLGTALTLSFLEEILKFYNPTFVINLIEKSAFTGGVSESGEILNTSKEIIKRKVSAIFFSQINSFVIPKQEETYAVFTLDQLKKNYSNRKLKLIPAEDISDVLNRRDVVDIKKQKHIVRTAKFVKKNWISAVATVLLAILFSYLFVMDFDDNPEILTTDGKTLFVKNKNGKILWTKLVSIGKLNINSESPLSQDARIIDINQDGKNEILLMREIDQKTAEIMDHSLLICYDKKGKLLWQYSFKDNVSSDREVLNNDYTIYLIDTLSINNVKSLFLIAANTSSFSSAIFRIDLLTGKRLTGTFWGSGIIIDAFIKDFDEDNKKEIFGLGYDNGFEDVVFFVYEIDSLLKARPTTEEYLIRNCLIAEMKVYLRFPKTDYENYIQKRTPLIYFNTLEDDRKNKKYRFCIANPNDPNDAMIDYKINYNVNEINIVIDSDFRVQRDTLVAHGSLERPYTDTEAYKEIIKNNILYWKDGIWVKRNELDE